MKNLNFLDLKSPFNLEQLTASFVRTTENINDDFSTIIVNGSVEDEYHRLLDINQISVIANLIPTYSNSKNVFLNYDNGIKKYLPKPIFPLEDGSLPIIQLEIEIEEIISVNGNKVDINLIPSLKNKKVFCQKFIELPNEEILNISSKNLVNPVYISPIKGTAMPLWCVGVYFSPQAALKEIESIFIFPIQSKTSPDDIDIRNYSYSYVVGKDKAFAEGKSKIFKIVQDIEPWNLLSCIEKGGAEFSLFNDLESVTFKSVHIEKPASLTEKVIITFVRK